MTESNKQPKAKRDKTGSEGHPKDEAAQDAKDTAEELGINLDLVQGTGPGGQITEKDVKAKVAELVRANQETSTPRINIINQYIVLKAILAGPEEKRLVNVPNFPESTFAPKAPPDWGKQGHKLPRAPHFSDYNCPPPKPT